MRHLQTRRFLLFQSTLSARRATPTLLPKSKPAVDFNPRSPRGERPFSFFSSLLNGTDFNPRSPRGERRFFIKDTFKNIIFQSTLSARRATFLCLAPGLPNSNFNPRSPRGERLARLQLLSEVIGFQSTLSARRAT